MTFTWEKFEKTNSRLDSRITVTGRRTFGFTTKFWTDNSLDQYKYVVLFFDKNEKAVGLKFTNSEEERHKFTIMRSKKGYGASIIATSFFKVYDIDPKLYRGRYLWEKISEEKEGEMYVIRLKERQDAQDNV